MHYYTAFWLQYQLKPLLTAHAACTYTPHKTIKQTGLMLYGALQGLQLGLLRSVTPLSNAEVDKDAAFTAAMAAIDAAADAATTATTASKAPTVGSASAALKTKELVKS
jgi:hypothetical protein